MAAVVLFLGQKCFLPPAHTGLLPLLPRDHRASHEVGPAVPQQDLAHAVGHTALLGPWYHQGMAISTLAQGTRSIAGLLPPKLAMRRSKLSCLGSEHGLTQLGEVSLPLLRGCCELCAFGSGWGGGQCCQTTLSTASLLHADPNPTGNI